MSEFTVASIEHVVKSFGDVVAVSDASFTVPSGAIMGFLGPNGAGKTTCIRMLLGLIRPQQGIATLFGVDPFSNHHVKALVGYIPEENAFPKWSTAKDYLTLLGRFNLPLEQAKARAMDVLSEVDLLEVVNKQIRQFSKGMKQRMKIAQALIHRPAFVIADEPFNGLDPRVRKNMFDVFRSYRDEYNSTFLISSHILFEVEKLADKIILLYKGRTIAQGTPHRIREMIQDQPHEIQITSNDSRKIANFLINTSDEKIIANIAFSKSYGNEPQITINTHRPIPIS